MHDLAIVTLPLHQELKLFASQLEVAKAIHRVERIQAVTSEYHPNPGRAESARRVIPRDQPNLSAWIRLRPQLLNRSLRPREVVVQPQIWSPNRRQTISHLRISRRMLRIYLRQSSIQPLELPCKTSLRRGLAGVSIAISNGK